MRNTGSGFWPACGRLWAPEDETGLNEMAFRGGLARAARDGEPDKIFQEGKNMLEAGVKAPDFTLRDKDGKEITLSDFRGKKVVLYFYPKDNTPGCTREACAFAGAYAGFEERGAAVIGVSKDSEASHKKFADKYNLPFILVSDPELVAIRAYDVWKEKKLYGKVSMGVVRATYIIDENGVIEKVYPKVKPDTNAGEILEYLDQAAGN